MFRPFADVATSGSLAAVPCSSRVATPGTEGNDPESEPSEIGGGMSNSSSSETLTCLGDALRNTGTMPDFGSLTVDVLTLEFDEVKRTLVSIAASAFVTAGGASAGRLP